MIRSKSFHRLDFQRRARSCCCPLPAITEARCEVLEMARRICWNLNDLEKCGDCLCDAERR